MEETTVVEQQGLSERMLRELIKSPKFKASLKVLTGNIDPDNAGGMVKTIVWEDVETSLGTVSALPAVIKYLVQAMRELVAQLNAFPTPILVAFLSQVVEDVDFKAMEYTVSEFKALVEKLHPVVESLKEASSGITGQVAE
jgi:hypothetical protein